MGLDLRLRAPEMEDLDFIVEVENDPSVWEAGVTNAPMSRSFIEEFIRGYDGDILRTRQLRLIAVLDGTTPVAIVDLFDYEPLDRRAGVGIVTTPQFRRRGVALESLKCLRKIAQRLNIVNLWAVINQENVASLKLFEKAGYEVSGVLKSWIIRGGKHYDARIVQQIIGK